MPAVPAETQWEIGKHALLSVCAAKRNGRTIVQPVRRRTPYQFQGVHYQDHDDQPFVLLHNSAGGLVEGDVTELHVEALPEARVLLTTMGATKFYKSVDGNTAREVVTLTARDRSVIEYLPDEVIPFADSRARRSTIVDVAPTARVFLTDLLSAGRIHYGGGEAFAFTDLESTLQVSVAGRLMIRDRLAVADEDVAALARLWGGHNHLATAVAYASDMPESVADAIERETSGMQAVIGASCRNRVLCARVLAKETWELHEAIYAIWSVARPYIAEKKARTIRKC